MILTHEAWQSLSEAEKQSRVDDALDHFGMSNDQWETLRSKAMSAPAMNRDNGSIHLRRSTVNKSHWTGATAADCGKLRHCDCPRSFSDADYDMILYKVSEQGYDLATPVEDDE